MPGYEWDIYSHKHTHNTRVKSSYTTSYNPIDIALFGVLLELLFVTSHIHTSSVHRQKRQMLISLSVCCWSLTGEDIREKSAAPKLERK